MVVGQYRALLVETCWFVLNRIGSVWGGTGWYLVALGQYNFVLFGIKWYWVSIGLKSGDLIGCYHSGTDE